MAYSYFDTNTTEIKEYTLNKYFVHKFENNTFLITTPSGAWIVLNNEEYDLFRFGKLHKKPNLFKLLSEKGVILTKENSQKIIQDYRDRYHYLSNGVSLNIITPTLKCNQQCIYCHSQAKPNNLKGYTMDEKTAKSTVDFIFQSPAETIQIEFQGGECLLNYPIMKYIIEYSTKLANSKKKKLGYSVVTNLTLMDDEKLDYFTQHQNLGIATSFDGPKCVHDKNRIYLNGKGTYDDVTYWIKKIKSDKKMAHRLNAMPTITKHSLPYAKEIIDEYRKYGFDKTWIRYLGKMGYAHSSWNEIGYTAQQFIEFWKESLEYTLQLNKQGINFAERLTQIYTKKIIDKKDPYYSELQAPCGAAIGQMLYNYKGDIFPCDESKIYDIFKLGNVKSDKYADIYKKPTTKNIIRATTNLSSLCDACAFSPYCGTCLVETYASEGGLVSKLPSNRRCIMNKEILKHIFKKLIYSKEDREIIFSWISTTQQIK